ncbi:hypothetical protein SR71_08420 [Klebsiella aerogenes]|uniref:phage portal protein n=1 Tax=Klebsiella aerogenes TaxID=548 RepID=UPI0005EE3929|nr:DUF1073 domain-containing protein [Klebsiella aerogenes]KJP58459.1 hypothetical protein SR71_08420 [Klebsiella aerogenes]
MAKRNNRQQKKIDKKMNMDSYQNVFMNIGTAGDRSAYSKIRFAHLLNRSTLDNIYIGDGLGRRIVDVVADEMFRAGFTVDGASNQPDIMSRWDELNLTQHYTDAIAWSRLYGGSLILFGVNDGGDLTSPLVEGELEFVRVYDRHQVQPSLRDINPESRTYGEVIQYQINPISGTPYYVHASRCHIFDGERLPNQIRHQNKGWGASCLQGIYEALIDFGMSHKHATSLLERKQQGVWSAADLADLCKDGEGRDAVQARLNMVDMTRSNGNTIGVDATTEKYELLNGSLEGVVDVQDRKKQLICALTGIPESVLFGTRPSGMNADDSEVPESWKQLIGRKQKDEARPAIEKAVSLLTSDKTWTIKFNPLSVPTEKEMAETANQWSQADERYSQLGWVSNDEGIATLKSRGGYVYPEVSDG